MKQSFTEIELKVKPHIRHYLHYHFGNPCKIPSGHFIFEFVKLALSSQTKKDEIEIKTLTDSVKISIGFNDFTRYGHTITKTSALKLNDSIDNFIRSQIRTLTDIMLRSSEINEDWKRRYIQLNKEHKELMNLNGITRTAENEKLFKKFEAKCNKRIKEFEHYNFKVTDALMQSAYIQLGFDETILPFETIRKDYYRNRIRQND